MRSVAITWGRNKRLLQGPHVNLQRGQNNQTSVDLGGMHEWIEDSVNAVICGAEKLTTNKSNPPLGRPAQRHRPTAPFLVRLDTGLRKGVHSARSQREGRCIPK